MNKFLKIQLIIVYFLIMYLPAVFSQYLPSFLFEFELIICNIYIIYILYKSNILTVQKAIKIILFALFLYILFFIDRLLVTIFLCGMDGVGFLQRSGIVDYHYMCSEFSGKENLYFNFISTLYYPIYIFLFIIPFAKHLDSSNKNKKEQDAQKGTKVITHSAGNEDDFKALEVGSYVGMKFPINIISVGEEL